MSNLADTIRLFNAGRDPERLAMKYAAMRANAFAFLRGSCHLFYARLAEGVVPPLPDSPPAWVCGDLHLENFGSYKGDNRLVYFDLNDFDESALAPLSWDLLRLLSSVWVAAPALKLDARQAESLCKQFIGAYSAALASGQPRWLERDNAHGPIKQLLDKVRERKRVDLLNARTRLDGRRRLLRCDGKRALAAGKQDQARARALVHSCAAALGEPDFFEVLDVARRIAGTGSLGVERYVVLVEGKGSPDKNYLLDVKLALPSSLAPHLPFTQPSWTSEAQRIVTIQSRIQAMPTAFLHSVVRSGKSYVLRGLQPGEDKVDLDQTRKDFSDLGALLADMGRLLAWGQLRSAGRQGSANADALIAFGAARASWQRPLLASARGCARQAARDWKSYAAAYDAGQFDSPS
ncbi:MAG: DUF2252 family protein [Pseudomonadota bacterium]